MEVDDYALIERAAIKWADADEPWEEALRHAREEQEGGFLPLKGDAGRIEAPETTLSHS